MNTKLQPFLFFLLLMGLFSSLYAQSTYRLTYGGVNNDYNVGLVVTPSGKIATCGGETGINGWNLFKMFYLNIFDTDGNNMDSKELGYVSEHYANVIENTPDGGFIIAGMGKHCTGIACGEDGLIFKTDSMGNIQWTTAIGSSLPLDFITDIVPVSNGYLFCGPMGENATTNNWLMGKLNLSGDTAWTTTFSSSSLITSDDTPFSMMELSDGSIIVTGRFYSSTVSSSFNIGLCKLDAGGNVVWCKIAENLGWGKSILPLTDGFLICTGGLLVKTDFNGNMIFAKRIPLTMGYRSFEGMCFENSSHTNVLVCGYSGSDPMIFKADINGNMIWSVGYSIPESCNFRSIAKLNDGRIAIGGDISTTGVQNQEALLYVTDAFGNLTGGCSYPLSLSLEDMPPGYSFTSITPYYVSGPIVASLSGTVADLPSANQTFSKSCNATYYASIHNETLNTLKVYPNPTSNSIILEGIEMDNIVSVHLVDVLGKRESLTLESSTVDLKSVTPGIYWLEVGLSNNSIYSVKIIKQ